MTLYLIGERCLKNIEINNEYQDTGTLMQVSRKYENAKDGKTLNSQNEQITTNFPHGFRGLRFHLNKNIIWWN